MYGRKPKLGENIAFVADAIVSRINEEADTAEDLFWE